MDHNLKLDAVYASPGQVERRCNCDTSSAECAWTQPGFTEEDFLNSLP